MRAQRMQCTHTSQQAPHHRRGCFKPTQGGGVSSSWFEGAKRRRHDEGAKQSPSIVGKVALTYSPLTHALTLTHLRMRAHLGVGEGSHQLVDVRDARRLLGHAYAVCGCIVYTGVNARARACF